MNKQLQKFDLSQNLAVVTGGARGIGRDVALGLARAGADIVIADILKEEAKSTREKVEEVGRECDFFKVDISENVDIKNFADDLRKKYESVDILVNAAGVIFREKAEEVTEENWDKTLKVNLKGLFFCCQEIGKIMIEQGGGKIINISSIQGEEVLPTRAPYAASKGGVKQVTKSLAVEWAQHNINVNAIAPAFIRTPMVEKVLEEEPWGSTIIKNTPMRRVGETEEVADAVHFLATEASSFITGHVMLVDGGWTAGDFVEGI